MNNGLRYLIISGIAFISAILFFAVYNQWILLRYPWASTYEINQSISLQKKQICLFYFHGDKWKSEKQEMLWSPNIEKNIFQIINAWLTLLDEESIMAKRITLQSALISTSHCAYLSFDNNILEEQETIFKKWMLIEGLLKTIVLNDISIMQIQFLVHHHLLSDAHIDFSLPWPIHGFLMRA